MVGHGGSSAGLYLADPTSPIPSHCASIVATSTLRVNLTSGYYTASNKCISDNNHRKTRTKTNIVTPSLLLKPVPCSPECMGNNASWPLNSGFCIFIVRVEITFTVLVATIDAQWEGMGDVGLARYEPALLPPCPTIRVLKLQ